MAGAVQFRHKRQHQSRLWASPMPLADVFMSEDYWSLGLSVCVRGVSADAQTRVLVVLGRLQESIHHRLCDAARWCSQREAAFQSPGFCLCLASPAWAQHWEGIPTQLDMHSMGFACVKTWMSCWWCLQTCCVSNPASMVLPVAAHTIAAAEAIPTEHASSGTNTGTCHRSDMTCPKGESPLQEAGALLCCAL